MLLSFLVSLSIAFLFSFSFVIWRHQEEANEQHGRDNTEATACMPIVPTCELPRKVIAAMVAAGAQKEEVKDEDLRVIRVDGVDSDGWKEYKNWVLSLGEVDPLVMAYFGPPSHLRRTLVCPPNAMGVDIMDKANGIVNHFAALRMNAFAVGIPALLAPLAPIVGPAAPVNVYHATVAVTALLQAFSNPGAGFPVINALHQGQYVCHVHYQWRGAVITVPIFRLCRDLPQDFKMKDFLSSTFLYNFFIYYFDLIIPECQNVLFCS